MEFARKEHLEGGFNITVGRIPYIPPFLEGKLHTLWEDPGGWGRDILRKFMLQARTLQFMTVCMSIGLVSDSPYLTHYWVVGVPI